ncbi:hypothetical protein FRC06_001857 [Ceratobasidium sp. 370]|nr:hypothetical protein FRC06_001857 [Ceratobasidium sp. 370]
MAAHRLWSFPLANAKAKLLTADLLLKCKTAWRQRSNELDAVRAAPPQRQDAVHQPANSTRAGQRTGLTPTKSVRCGDRDSLGVFQQRPSAGWCKTPSQCLDVKHATNAFIDKAIRVAKPSMTAAQLAQAVQVSAFPHRYVEAEPKAKSIIAALGGY